MTKQEPKDERWRGIPAFMALIGFVALIAVVSQSKDAQALIMLVIEMAEAGVSKLRSAFQGLADLGAVFWAIVFFGCILWRTAFILISLVDRRLGEIVLLLEEHKRERV